MAATAGALRGRGRCEGGDCGGYGLAGEGGARADGAASTCGESTEVCVMCTLHTHIKNPVHCVGWVLALYNGLRASRLM